MSDEEKYSQLFNTDQIRDNLKEKAVRGGVFTMSCQAVETVFRIGSTAILARILVPEHFGLIGMVTGVLAIAEVAKDFGLSTATVQQKEITHEQVSKLFWVNVAISFLIMLIISSCSFLIAGFFQEERLIYITIAISTGFLWAGLTVQHQALLKRQMKFLALGVIQIGSTVLSTVLAVVLALKGYEYWALVWREVCRGLLIAIGTWIGCPWMPQFPKRSTKISHLISFGRNVAGFNVIVYLAANIDQILIGKLWGPAPVGIFRQAYNLVYTPVLQLANPINRVAVPALSILQGDAEKYRNCYKKILTTLSFITMPVILFWVVHSYDIVLIVLGEKWVASADILRILAISAYIKPASTTTGYVLITCGMSKKYFELGVASGVILLISVSIGVFWGALGVAYGHLGAAFVLLFVQLRYSFSGTPVSVTTFYEAIRRPMLSSLAMMIVLICINNLMAINNSALNLIKSLPAAALAYLLAWMCFRGGKEALKELIYDIVKPLHIRKAI